MGSTVSIALSISPNTLIFKNLSPNKMEKEFEVLIIGGSYAGLSAAMALGRSLRRVLVIDSGLPCNHSAPHSHNFITHDGEAPAKIARKARKQVERYDTVHLHKGLAVEGKKTEAGFEVKTQAGEVFFGKKLVFATGIRDLLPDIPGLTECWGKTVIHCPYCHGYEFRQQKMGIMANGQRAFHLASLVNNLTSDLTVMTNGKSDFETVQWEKLRKHGVKVIESEIAKTEQEGGQIKNVIFKDGSRVGFDAAYAAVPFVQHSEMPAWLGCELTEQGYVKVNPFQQTNIEGVFACGDNSSMMRSVANAVATGNMAGAMVNAKLVEEYF